MRWYLASFALVQVVINIYLFALPPLTKNELTIRKLYEARGGGLKARLSATEISEQLNLCDRQCDRIGGWFGLAWFHVCSPRQQQQR